MTLWSGRGATDSGILGGITEHIPFPPDYLLFIMTGSVVGAGVLVTSTLDRSVLSTFLFNAFMYVGLPLFLFLGTIWFRQSKLPRDTGWSIVAGYVAGTVFIALLLLWANLPAVLAGGPVLSLAEEFLFFGNLGGYFGFIAGVSRARNKYNEQLRRDLEISNELVERSPAALWMINHDGPELLYINSTYETLFGQSTETVYENPWAFIDTVHPEHRTRAREEVARSARGESTAFQVRVNPSENYERWLWVELDPIYEDGEQVATSGFARDISELKANENRLVNLHEATRQLFQAESKSNAANLTTNAAEDLLDLHLNSVFFADLDTQTLNPVATSDTASSVFDEVPTLDAGGSLAWKVYESGEPLISDDITTNEERYNPDTDIRSEIILPIDGYGVFIAGAQSTGAFDTRHISLAQVLVTNLAAALDRIDHQSTLEARQTELKRQNERLEEFAGIVSHDLRNPLTVAQGNVEFLREDYDLDQAPEVERISTALERMNELIDDLLQLASAGAEINEVEAVSLQSIVTQCWATISSPNADLDVRTTKQVLADRSRLRQLFENLFRNAIEHANHDVTVTVGDMENGFYVTDTGPGIPDEDQERIFKAGFSTNTSGTGFGLSIVQTVADAHGWEVSVTDSESGGTRFEFTNVTQA